MSSTQYGFFTSNIDSLFDRADVQGDVWYNKKKISRDTPIFRYTSLLSLLQILEGSIHFSTRKAFSDRREQGEYKDPILKLEHTENILLGKRNNFIHSKNKAFRLSETFFVSCWSLSPEESYPMWRAYTFDRYGIRIEATLGSIIDSINFSNCQRVYISPIAYGEEKDLISPMDILFYKTNGYSIENEVRIYAIANNNCSDSQKTHIFGHDFSLDPSTFLKGFSFSPFLNPSEQCRIASLLFSRYEWLQEIITSSCIMEY